MTTFGTLEDESTLVVERSTVGDVAGTAYVLLVFFVAGIRAFGRFIRDWWFDRDYRAFVPRVESLSIHDVIPAGNSSGGDRND